MSITVKQESIYKGHNWWQWAVWLDGSTKELDTISHVVYTLHPTFPTPVRRIDNRKEKFRLDSAGWGEFEIYLDIVYKNGQTRKRKHRLKLKHPKREKPTVGLRQVATESELPKKAVLFLSSTVADADMAGIMRKILSKYDITIVPPEELLAGVPLGKMLGEMISNADVAVFVISGRPSLWMNHEIETALTHKVRTIVPILVGKETEIPASLREFKAMQVNSPSEIEKVAQHIAETSISRK